MPQNFQNGFTISLTPAPPPQPSGLWPIALIIISTFLFTSAFSYISSEPSDHQTKSQTQTEAAISNDEPDAASLHSKGETFTSNSESADDSSPGSDSSGRLFPLSNSCLLTEEDILNRLNTCGSSASRNQLLFLARLELLAAKGESFENNAKRRTYFEQFEWYQNLNKHPVSDSELSNIERQNLKLFASLAS